MPFIQSLSYKLVATTIAGRSYSMLMTLSLVVKLGSVVNSRFGAAWRAAAWAACEKKQMNSMTIHKTCVCGSA